MNPDEPTHFNVLIAGTGLHESILAAALSKAGYSVLQLDSATCYGTEHASLSLKELAQWAKETEGAEASSPSSADDLLRLSQRFAISLFPMLLRATGPALDLLIRSKVATYLQFGLLGGVGLYHQEEGEDKKGKERVDRVPASKADVFNDSSLSLVEKRRLTKLLLFAAGQDPLEEDKVLLQAPDISFSTYLSKAFSLSGAAADSLAYALALCSTSSDPALPALQRLRNIIHAVGRYGPSPYLVGHYGGAGDLVGGFSRICAVWGGGQILGRPLGELDLSPPIGKPVPPSQPPFMVHENHPPPPAAPSTAADSDSPATRPLGIPVVLETGEQPTMFTGDWVVSSPHLLSTLSPSHTPPTVPSSVHLIAILPSPVPFPPPREPRGPDEGDEPDSNLFVFPPQSLSEELGTVTAFQVGKGTMSTPEGYHTLYFSAPLLSPSASSTSTASTLLEPYLNALLSLPPPSPASDSSDSTAPALNDVAPSSSPIEPLYTVSYISPSPSSSSSTSPSSPLPPNFLSLPPLPSGHRSSALVDALDDLVPLVEETFWKIVGEEGRKEGVQFFAKEQVASGEEDEED
ncbi:hypothetical protein JCM11251_004011 [Rhodosporidiobolus azoricus]